MQPIDYLGTSPLFLGVETANWQLEQFETAAYAAKELGITSLLIKVADGGNIWYDGIGGWQKVLDAVKPIIKAVAYMYSYGDSFNALQDEIAILSEVMTTEGIVIADMEVEYNGHDDWAKQVCAALLPVPGMFGVTTWADPNLQDWWCVLAKLKPCVNFWLPQVYSDFLAEQYHVQFEPYGLPYYPVLNLESSNIMRQAYGANSPIIAFWEYQLISTYAEVIKAIVALPHLTMPMATVPTPLLQAIKTKVAELEVLLAQLP
jgi:hypothetical protein